jgi:ubiquinone/menaquinone biosynthesis C-methylase UbiE
MTPPLPTLSDVRDAWELIADGYDRHTTPIAAGMAETVLDHADAGPGQQLLDVASGSGALSLAAARRGLEVTAVDIAPTMIDRLVRRAEAEGLAGVEGRVMDGQALAFADDRFDVVVSQNGVSLFPDLPRGLAEMARVARPGGRVLIAAFGAMHRAEFLGFFLAALQAALPGFVGPPMDPPLAPFQVADPAVLRQRLVDAGLHGVEVSTVVWRMELRSAAHLWEVVASSNPIGARLTASLSAEHRTAALDVLDGMLRERSGGTPAAVLTTEMHLGHGTP